jgi:uncharacterized protein
MIYADSGIIMRWVEGTDRVRNPIQERWRQLAPTDQVFIASRLAKLECRCKPPRDQDGDLLRLYDFFFAGREVDIREIDAAVVEKATGVRASLGLKVPDAIHTATAMIAGASEFWTTDQRLTRCPDLIVRVFSAV